MSEEKRFKTLFLCTGNSARSILAEYLLQKIGVSGSMDGNGAPTGAAFL